MLPSPGYSTGIESGEDHAETAWIVKGASRRSNGQTPKTLGDFKSRRSRATTQCKIAKRREATFPQTSTGHFHPALGAAHAVRDSTAGSRAATGATAGLSIRRPTLLPSAASSPCSMRAPAKGNSRCSSSMRRISVLSSLSSLGVPQQYEEHCRQKRVWGCGRNWGTRLGLVGG